MKNAGNKRNNTNSISSNEQYLAHLREKYIFQIQGIEEAGYDKGYRNGIKERAERRQEK